MVNKNIIKIRKKLDILDNSFLRLIKKRTYLVKQVLKNKLKLKKYNPNTRKHEFFIEKKLPPHSK